MTDLFLNEWKSQVEFNSSCYIYQLFKQKFGFEEYLINAPAKFRKYLIKFRTRNHRLPIETGDGEEFQEKTENVTCVIQILETNSIISWSVEN